MPKVHQEKCQIIKHIDSRNLVVEFDAIEKPGSILGQIDIAQMKIAVAAPDHPRSFAAVQLSAMTFECCPERIAECRDFGFGKHVTGCKTTLVDVKHGLDIG